MSEPRAERIALAADAAGIGALLRHVPRDRVACVIAAALRPQHLPALGATARELGVPLMVQPRLRDAAFPEFLRGFTALRPDLLICNSYSMLFPTEVLLTVSGNAVNAHAALLPVNRGPNPLQWCLIHDQRQTGVTLHFMDPGADDGDIIAQRPVAVTEEDTWVTLSERCDAANEALLEAALPAVLDGRAPRVPQDARLATQNPRLTPAYPRINWAVMSDREIFNLIRAQVAPLGGAYCVANDGTRTVIDRYVPLREIPRLRERHAARC